MEQVLHILRKDLRHLWPRALVVLMLVVAYAVFAVRSLPVNSPELIRANSVSGMLTILLPLAMWFLIASLIFQEALPGDRQFWLTRPYRWPKLLISKILFIVIVINASLFASDCYVLGTQGFPVLSVFPDLLLRQLFITALFILPSFAVATLTAGLSQFLLAWFILLLAVIAETMFISGLFGSNMSIAIGDSSIFLAVLVATTCGIVVWQYAGRRTTAARIVALTIACAFLPATLGVSLLAYRNSATPQHARSVTHSAVQIAYDLDTPSHVDGRNPNPGFVLTRIPLKVVGMPPETLLRGSARIALNIGGTAWPRPGGLLIGSVERIGNEYWQTLDLEKSKFDLVKQEPIDLHAIFDLEIVGDRVETRVSVTERLFFVSTVGLCHTFHDPPQTQITCRAGLEPSLETAVRLEGPPLAPEPVLTSFSSHFTPWGLSPTSEVGGIAFSNMPGSVFAFIPRRKIADLQRTLDLRNFRLTTTP